MRRDTARWRAFSVDSATELWTMLSRMVGVNEICGSWLFWPQEATGRQTAFVRLDVAR